MLVAVWARVLVPEPDSVANLVRYRAVLDRGQVVVMEIERQKNQLHLIRLLAYIFEKVYLFLRNMTKM